MAGPSLPGTWGCSPALRRWGSCSALSSIKKNPGATGRGRAWFGIILGGLMFVSQLALTVLVIISVIMNEAKRNAPRRLYKTTPEAWHLCALTRDFNGS
jgi:hypothetical protein